MTMDGCACVYDSRSMLWCRITPRQCPLYKRTAWYQHLSYLMTGDADSAEQTPEWIDRSRDPMSLPRDTYRRATIALLMSDSPDEAITELDEYWRSGAVTEALCRALRQARKKWERGKPFSETRKRLRR